MNKPKTGKTVVKLGVHTGKGKKAIAALNGYRADLQSAAQSRYRRAARGTARKAHGFKVVKSAPRGTK